MKEPIDRDLFKYLESWQTKEGCGLEAAEAESGGWEWGKRNPGRKGEIAKLVGRTAPNTFSKTIALCTILLSKSTFLRCGLYMIKMHLF